MTGTAMAAEFASWSAPGHSFRIEYSEAVLEQIRETALDGYHRVPHGGVETGGILFGVQQENLVRIMAWQPVICEYAKGPSFLLSEKDEAALAEALESWRGDAELARLEPVGWYRAHTRSEVLLSDADLAFFNRFFPQPWQVGLIVRPASFAPTRAGFFFREADGAIHAESSYLEFTLMPVATAPAPPPAEAPQAPSVAEGPKAPPAVVPTPESPAVTAAEPSSLPESEPYPPVRGGASWKWYAASLIVLAGAALGFWLLKPSHPSLTLTAADVHGQLRIAWDGAARSIGRATGGSIDIDDRGVRTQVNLTPADLRSGNLYYERQSGDVAVRLTVDVPGSPPLMETTRFLRPGESGPAPAPRLDAAKQPEPQLQPEAREAHVEPPPAAAPTPETPLPSLQPPAPVETARRVIPFRAPAPAKAPRQSSSEIPSIAPPKIENLPAAPSGGLASVLGPVAGSPPTLAAPPRQPTAGRIIWTGKLAKNARLVVELNHASSGAISGVLPAVTARVSAYPGDLTADGITLFTADPRYSEPVTEKAGAENGWNPTTYTWDPKRAAGIKVVEQPGPQNGYKLVLESDMPKLSVVMLEWRAAQ
jgi:outer membrane biosynthesis protein TonB/proteasome lid subunit RPN8/RPN11